MKRVAVFASYDKNGIIHDYVLEYLKYLSKDVDKIIFIADNYASQSEKDKIKNLVFYYEFLPHGEYDFGSYKRGYLFAKENHLLDDADELIFCNDSCFCLSPFSAIFETMTDKECDLWGVTSNEEYQRHLQSYFMVFKRQLFTNDCFWQYLLKIKKEKSFWDIVQNYELPLTSTFEKQGFKSLTFLKKFGDDNPTFYPMMTLSLGLPLVKRKIFSAAGYSKESVYKTFKTIASINKMTANNVLSYFKTTSVIYIVFRLMLQNLAKNIPGFIYRNKITKSGNHYIKICKIPVYYKKNKLKDAI